MYKILVDHARLSNNGSIEQLLHWVSVPTRLLNTILIHALSTYRTINKLLIQKWKTNDDYVAKFVWAKNLEEEEGPVTYETATSSSSKV